MKVASGKVVPDFLFLRSLDRHSITTYTSHNQIKIGQAFATFTRHLLAEGVFIFRPLTMIKILFLLQNAQGKAVTVPSDALIHLLGLFKDNRP